jgi:hypothetical protein
MSPISMVGSGQPLVFLMQCDEKGVQVGDHQGSRA